MSSFIGGTVAILVLAFLAPSLGEVAFLFGLADYCALMLVGFVCVSFVTTGSLLNGMSMSRLGQIGTDVTSGMQRFTLGIILGRCSRRTVPAPRPRRRAADAAAARCS